MTSIKDIQKKNDKELVTFVNDKREETRSFRFGVAGAGTRDVRKVRTSKKEIARALTELNSRARNNNDAK
jgi:ribosomal protein L29